MMYSVQVCILLSSAVGIIGKTKSQCENIQFNVKVATKIKKVNTTNLNPCLFPTTSKNTEKLFKKLNIINMEAYVVFCSVYLYNMYDGL